jgi:ribonuclease P protein component
VLPAANRLRRKRDFKLAYNKGRSFVHPMLVLYVRPTREGACRIGFSISKKLGGAVERNRIKRRLREVMRTYVAQPAKLRPACDVVLVGRGRLKDATFEAIEGAVADVLKRAKLLRTFAEPAGPPGAEAEPCDAQSSS